MKRHLILFLITITFIPFGLFYVLFFSGSGGGVSFTSSWWYLTKPQLAITNEVYFNILEANKWRKLPLDSIKEMFNDKLSCRVIFRTLNDRNNLDRILMFKSQAHMTMFLLKNPINILWSRNAS